MHVWTENMVSALENCLNLWWREMIVYRHHSLPKEYVQKVNFQEGET